MKLNIRHIAYALTLISVFASGTSCMKENAGGDAPRSGEKAFLSLKALAGNLDKVVVKSWNPNTENERFVNNLRVYVFSESGSLVGYKYFSNEDLKFGNDFNSATGYDYSSELTGIPVTTGNVYIYGVANAVTTQYYVEDQSLLDGNASLTREKFLKATFTRQQGAYNPQDNTFIMCGEVNGGNTVTVQRITGTVNAEITSPTDDDSKRLKLYKTVSKNTFTVKAGTGITFTPDYIEIHNVPQHIGLAHETEATASDFEDFDRVVVDESTFTFYLPENIQTANDVCSSFNDREKNSYSGDAKSFVNAPENATYIVVHGRFNSNDYVGDLAYTVHLGDFSHDLSDFSVKRNCHYEYTLTINGVNNFIAESKKTEGADDPGSEGMIISPNSGEFLEVDCHYESRVLNFSMAELDKLVVTDGFGYILKIHTPFCETISMLVDGDGNIYDAVDYKAKKQAGVAPVVLTTLGTDGLPADPSQILVSGEADYSWIHFVLNTSNYEYPVSYPGTSSEELMTVFQALQKMYTAGKNKDTNFFNNGGTAYLTCFIDENYYANKNWTEYVNQTQDRKVYFANEFYTSEDKKSSYAEAKYLISQKSIWTFYAQDSTLKPFGTESVSEESAEGKVVSSGNNVNQQNWNARASAISNNRGKKWTALTATKRIEKQSLYLSSAYNTCMSRNRDENGNGTIDEDEIKWYLASVDQYKGLWIGEKALPTAIKLFQPTEANWTKLNDKYNKSDANLKPWHFFTCSAQNTFWAEEGCSTGADNSAEKVRCVRTLESNGEGLEDADAFYSTTTNTDKTTDITLKISDDVKRAYQSSSMSPSYERGEETTNNVYTKFRVASSDLSDSYDRSKIINSTNGGDFIKASADVCNTKNGGAWRVPNQKELSIISISGISLTHDIWSNTSFTGMKTDYYKNGQTTATGFKLLSTSQMTIANGKTAYVRCVMDVKD